MRMGAIGRLAALGVVFSAVAMMAWTPASAQVETREGIALQNQILELQREIQALQQNQGAGGGYQGYGSPPPYAQQAPGGNGATSDVVTTLLSRVEALEASVRDLRGQVQDLQNQLQQQTADLNKKIGDLQFQMQNGAAGAPAAGRAVPPVATLGSVPAAPPPKPVAAPPASARRTPELDLRDGYAALSRHDYAQAEKDARTVLANKVSPHSAEAQYVLAQALLGQKKYSQAAIAFDDSYNRSRKGPYAADSLLGLADSLVDINEKRAACDTLAKLRAEFPNQSADVRQRAEYAGRRAGCH